MDQPEFSLYVFVKLQVYQRVGQLAGGGPPGPRAVDSVLSGITARRIHSLMTARGRTLQQQRRQYTDFFDISSYFVRERLKSLNHGTILLENGRGLRHSIRYRWNEPIEERTLSDYGKMRALIGDHLSFGLDLYRIVDHFGTDPFALADVVQVFRDHRQRFIERRWYEISTRTPSRAPQFTQFLLQRLGDLRAFGLLEADASGQSFRVAPRGLDVALIFELFAYSMNHKEPSRGLKFPLTAHPALTPNA